MNTLNLSNMKKYLVFILLIMLNVVAFADNYKVTANKLNIRACANKNCEVIGQLYQNDVVNLQEIITSEDGNEWGKITLSNNSEGYVMMQYLETIIKTDNSSVKEKKDDFFLRPLFYMGLISLVVFFILFRISYKKRIPIFFTIWDIVLLVISAVFMTFTILSINQGNFSGILLVLALIPFFISVFLTIRTSHPINFKVISIICKSAFLLSALVLFLITLTLLIADSSKERKDKYGRQLYDEDGKKEYVSGSAWKKLKKYWREMKEMSRKH